ncbi:MAG: hypothetical protein AUH92_01445 [Acidobacteria bacterium 13_1_40CM_4_69_4]|nr:MAG: hypothetical protein AUH92_01445 [Acidobacteria bacterium 13_1_40CM_4_69_4]
MRPLRASAPSWENRSEIGKVVEIWMPPASTRSHSPAWRHLMPASTAMSDEAHAASTVKAGPIRSSRLAIRPHITLCARPGAVSGLNGGRPAFRLRRSSLRYSGVCSGWSRFRRDSTSSTTMVCWKQEITPRLTYVPRPRISPAALRLNGRSR